MITGKVTANREIVVEIDVAGPAHQFQRTQALIDTGYNGQLTLPPQLIRALKLPFAGHRRATLADGSTILLDVFVAEVLWQSTRQRRYRLASSRSAACRHVAFVGLSRLV